MKKLTLLLLIFITAHLHSQNFNDALRLSEPGILANARSLGLGNSYVALSNDLAGVTMNPAGLGMVNGSMISGGLLYNAFGNNTTLFGNQKNYSANSNYLSNIGVLIDVPTYRGSMVFAANFNRVKDFNGAVEFNGFNNENHSLIQDLTFFNDDIPYDLRLSFPVFDNDGNYLYDSTNIMGRLNQSGLIKEEGSLNSWGFSGAVEIARNLYVGATLNIYSGEYLRKREYYEEDTRQNYQGDLDPTEPSNDFQLFYANDVIDWDLSGWDFKFGLVYEFNRFGKFGFTVKTLSQFTIREKYVVDAESEFGGRLGYKIETFVSEIEYDIATPYELSGGFAFDMYGIIFSGQATLIDYTQMEFSDGLDTEQRSQNNRDIDELFRPVISFSVGTEYKMPWSGIRLRAGFMLKPSPYENDPSEFDKKYFTAGIGIPAGNVLMLDLGYAHGWWETFGDNYDFNLSRTFQDITTDTFLFNVTYMIN